MQKLESKLVRNKNNILLHESFKSYILFHQSGSRSCQTPPSIEQAESASQEAEAVRAKDTHSNSQKNTQPQ